MKNKIWFSVLTSSVWAATTALASISMNFTNFNFTPITAATGGSGKIVGSQYKATNVANLGGAGGVNSIDAIFTVTAASVNNSSLIYFANEAGRGDDVRLRFKKLSAASIWAKVSISFVQSGTLTAVNVASVTGDNLRVQFDDLDSDVGSNRADFAGMQTSQTTQTAVKQLAEITDLTVNYSLISGYTVGVLPGPFTPWGNVTSTDPYDQSPVTIGFNTIAPVINLVMGVTGTGQGNRHIDIDMTPDFVMVPESSAFALLIGAAALGFVACRRRR
ncbi:hypothetical protein SH580_21605 [Coraliomargarita algicola]|uniref:PEP-CTERM protein-sorting domain-containing protein n=1 Tax=Coraliomargarita algicola TaxID=3092156 RepID=A0ABZ0RII6_9BACT|nr:hypothetical protein [Coraliomargarita sp. J2-16]WPJ96014.1 hypothetical protein SH580_21605 [Coraliomargarita sp. J2-16]